MPSTVSGSTLSETLSAIGAVQLETPSAINIYAETFENKEHIDDLIEEYNNSASEEDKISYTDYVALLMSGVTTMIDAVSYGLIGFVSISLIVSSIMIGIITYISVLERTKEIGILRSVGASKRDISRVFNAETTAIVGLAAGLIGIGVTLLMNIPISIIAENLTGIANIAVLPVNAGIILVVISVVLTMIAGLIPSKLAAKKDPVIALRSE
ncbi:MAG: ABC transporter permease [Ruminiclostridium sp.]